jgi:hypothetical protein
MADSATFDGGDDVPLFVSETPPRRRSGERANIDALREKVRDLGLDLKRNWTGAEAESAEATPEARAAAPKKDAREDADRDSPKEPAHSASSRDWAERLAEEYRADFLRKPQATASKPAPSVEAPEERPVWAHRAYAAGRLAFAVDGAIAPATRSALNFFAASRGLALKMSLGVLLVLAAAGLLRDWPQAAPLPPPPPPAPTAAWVEIAKPYPLYDLIAPSLAQAQRVYTARRHVSGGGREDVLSFGQFGGPKPFLRLSVYRHGTEDVPDPVYFVDMARRASALGLAIAEADLPLALPTRFGAFESGPLALVGPASIGRKTCRGFRLTVAAPGLTMGGFMCGGGDDVIGAAELACAIDRLDLLSAGQDRALSDFFGAAGNRKGRACAEAARRK